VGDPASYERIFDAWYRPLFEGGWQVDVVFDDGLPTVAAAVARWPVLVLPAVYVAGDEQLAWYADYAAAGGHLVLGFHPGYADPEARPRPELAPGPLRTAAGVSFAEFSNVAGTVPVRSDVLRLPASAAATGWADALEPAGAEVLAGYDHPHLGRWAAITTHRHGAGRVTSVGTMPDEGVGAALAGWLGADRVVSAGWRPLPESVTVSSARTAQGRVWFCANWGWDSARVTVPSNVDDLFSGATLLTGSPLELGAWELRVLVERIPTHDVRPVNEGAR
jgi:beta-galactosidase